MSRAAGQFASPIPLTRSIAHAAVTAIESIASIALVASVASCTTYARLEPDKVVGLSLHTGGTAYAAPSATADTVCANDADAYIVADLVYRGGERRQTWNGHGSRAGKLRFADLTVTAEPVSVNDTGHLHFPRDRPAALDRRFQIGASLRGRPVTAALTLTPRFDCGGAVDYRGEGGGNADSGDGGGDGGNGPAIRVALARIDTELNGRLLLVRVTREGAAPDYYTVDTRGPAGRFTVSAAGGKGAPGAPGSDGARGSDGEDGSVGISGRKCVGGGNGGNGGNGDRGGDGGDGGDGGNGGDGGSIAVEFAPSSARLADLVAYDVRGGAPGEAGEAGDGGLGGRGGEGGQGGPGGSTTGSDRSSCSTSNGLKGTRGSDGSSGSDGSPGKPGRPGHSGTVQMHAVDAADLWAAEIAAGVPIVLDDAER